MANPFRRAFRLDRRSAGDARSSVDEELAFHLAECVEELVAAGWSQREAEVEARRKFGDMEATRAYCTEVQTKRGREERRAMATHDSWQDLKYALRTLRRTPGYSALVVVTLAFGIAATTTIFSAMNPYLLRPLPYGDPDALVQVNQVNRVTGWDKDRFSYPQVADWAARSRAFEALGAYSYGSANLTGPQGPEQAQYSRVTANLFGEVLRAEPFLGRGFLPEEGLPGAEPVVLLGESLWRRRYNGDAAILGQTITADGVQRTVVGIMPERFNFPFGSARFWLPLTQDASGSRASMNEQIVARLNEGWTAEEARTELTGIQAELRAIYPETDGRMEGVTVTPLREALNFVWEIMSVTFAILLGAVVFVLLIACVNVASLTLARGSGRRREVAVRAAIGAPRGRLVRQLLTESLVLSVVGGALGILLSYWAVGLISPVLPEDLYRIGDIELDGTVLTFASVLTLLTPLAFGLFPALSASKVGLTEGLKEASRGSGGLATSRGRRLLVVAQVAMAVVLITGAGLMLRSMSSVQQIDLGFDAEHLVVAEIMLPAGAYPSAQERLDYVDRAVAELQRIPGVVSASASSWLPLNHETHTWQVTPSSQAGTPTEQWPLTVVNRAHPGYLETMGITLLAGRAFTALDGADGAPVVMVSRSLADRLWPGEDAVGKTLLGGADASEPVSYQVVGVVSDIQFEALGGGEIGTQLYTPTLQAAGRRYFLLARTEGTPGALIPAAREALGVADPDLPVSARPMTAVVGENLLQWSIGTVLLGIFGGGALLLATLGIYGLISYSVSQRRAEMGVRVALGASRNEIRRSVLGDGLRMTLVGLALGLVLAVALARLVASVFYGVSPFDPLTLGGVMALFLGVATVASLIPAERASRADPASVLRME
ncbi:MAG TPA: ABC transporter permease [Longimicrobiales bacterium]|nr:ABC transporter permease [Longimicrobiales bacterium]